MFILSAILFSTNIYSSLSAQEKFYSTLVTSCQVMTFCQIQIFFCEFGAPYMSHDNYFMEKKLYILLASHNIYQKQKTEPVYLIAKNNYDPFGEIGIFQNFPLPQQ